MCYPASTETAMGTTTCSNVTYVRYVASRRCPCKKSFITQLNAKLLQSSGNSDRGFSPRTCGSYYRGRDLFIRKSFSRKVTGDAVTASHPFFVKGDIKALRASCHLAHKRYIVRGAML